MIDEGISLRREIFYVLPYLGFSPRLQSQYRDRDLFIGDVKVGYKCCHVAIMSAKCIVAGDDNGVLSQTETMEDLVLEYVAVLDDGLL